MQSPPNPTTVALANNEDDDDAAISTVLLSLSSGDESPPPAATSAESEDDTEPKDDIATSKMISHMSVHARVSQTSGNSSAQKKRRKKKQKIQLLDRRTKKKSSPTDSPQEDLQRLSWQKDGPGGPNDTNNNSEIILIRWLMGAGNYDAYRGSNSLGKKNYCEEIAQILKRAGVRATRTASQVLV